MMIKIINSSDNDSIKALQSRSQLEFDKVNDTVEKIINDVENNKDNAVRKYTKLFDKTELSSFEIAQSEINEAYYSCDKQLIQALTNAKDNIWNFHEKQLAKSWIDKPNPDIQLGQIVTPLERVGVYIPGGTAAYPSSVLMCAVPAKVARVSEVIMLSPPSDNGKINKHILAAAKIAGVDRVFSVGGAQAVAAMAFGTESIPKVDKVVGPGNIYVTIAKKMVFGHIDIDMIAGPSELLVIADNSANPKYVAADLLSQAEHDALASCILITTSPSFAEQVQAEVEQQMSVLSRKEIAEKSISDFGAIIIAENLDEAFNISNKIAPEHLELAIENPIDNVKKVKNAGAIFVGHYSPEPLGDYYAGPNHTLPTSGTARFYSPLGVYDYMKKSSLIYYNREALERCKDDIITIAEAEGLTAHANSIRVRFEI